MHHTPYKFLKLSLSFLLVSFVFSCQPEEKPLSEDYLKADQEFRDRLSKGRDHYLKLVGLHPLVQGTNLFGGSDVNNIQLTGEGIPPTIGAIELEGTSFRLSISDSLEVRMVRNDSSIVSFAHEFVESSANAPMQKYQHLSWQVIKRLDEYFLRVKDENSELAKTFKGFERYPLQSNYLVEANYQPFEAIKTEDVNTQLGTNQEMGFVGILSFNLNGEPFELSVMEEGFVIVGDQTNDDTTYGGGRYVYIEIPEKEGIVMIDFNRLYNPPCVYSEFTTCPLPPAQNVLPIKIEAGEKYKQL